MAIEFRLKYIREAIDKNVNESLLKWNARKVLLNESFDEEDIKDICPTCMAAGKQRFLKYFYVNMEEAVFKCESTTCLYPFRNFKYKNYVDRTIFRYERVTATNENNSEQKIFTSPTKIESDDMEHFNLNWLDNSFPDDLDSILTTPSESEGKTIDIKEIIDNICNGTEATSKTSKSPPNIGIEQPTKAPPAKLSKCLQYIEDLSPNKLTHSNKVETTTSTKQISHDSPSRDSAANSKVGSVRKPGPNAMKKVRPLSTKRREIKPIPSDIGEQKPLGFLDWLDVVSKIGPKQMQEFEFASPAEISESAENHLTNNTEAFSEEGHTQPVLIELVGNQLSTGSKPCLLYQLDPSELQTTSSHSEATTHLEYPITTETLENILTGDQIDVSPVAPNVDHSTFVNENNLPADFQIIKTKIAAGSRCSKQEHPSIKSSETKRTKLKNELERRNMERMKLKRQEMKEKKPREKMPKEKKQKEIKPKKRKEANINKTFNIEAEDNFCGFETLEPFKTVTLRGKPLVWLKIE